jgi:hypothetical protein
VFFCFIPNLKLAANDSINMQASLATKQVANKARYVEIISGEAMAVKNLNGCF